MKNQMKIVLPVAVEEALARLSDAGFSAYAVGGCVRDSLLGRIPNDWDITTAARPEDIQRVFSDCRTLDIGIKHGTVTVFFENMNLEITTYRLDGAYEDNRHPISVTFSDEIGEDLARRDFTVNAMAYNPHDGLVDLFCGQKDLARGVIACVGDPMERFREDGLRILRAIRFASVLDFTVEEKTACAVHALSVLLQYIAVERIREELCKLICGRGAVRILREFGDVIGCVIPALGSCIGFAQNSKYHCYDVYEHSLRALAENQGNDLLTRLGILLHDVGKPLCYTEDAEGGHFKGHAAAGAELCHAIMRDLRFDNDTATRVTQLIEWHDREIPATPRAVKRLMCKMSDEDISRLMEIKRCDRLAHAKDYCTPSSVISEIPKLVAEIRRAGDCLSLRTLAIDGKDLIELGLPPGRRIGEILQILLDRVIDGELPNDAQQLRKAANELIGF